MHFPADDISSITVMIKRTGLTAAELSSMLLPLETEGLVKTLLGERYSLSSKEDPMKENVLDVLMYLFESFVDSEGEPEPDRNVLREELELVGFRGREIDRALDWLDGLNVDDPEPSSPHSTTVRVYDQLEQGRLDSQCRGYLLHLEQVGILTPAKRELVIDRLLALDTDDIDIEQIKWVVMMVLFSQPGQEEAYARMEDLVFADDAGWLH